MKMISCSNGHYYDSSMHNSCPYCSEGIVNSFDRKEKKKNDANSAGQTIILEQFDNLQSMENDKTVYITGNSTDQDSQLGGLVTAWLVIVSDDGKGKSFPLTFGMNSIGSGRTNDIYIENNDNTISQENHIIIIYDYQNNIFLLQRSEEKSLSYLNGSVFFDTKELKSNDKIKVGNTELIFISLCNENFTWEL